MESQQQQIENTFQQENTVPSSRFTDDLAALNSLLSSVRFSTPRKNTVNEDEVTNFRSSPTPPSARPVESATTVAIEHPKCPYCDKPHPKEEMAAHKENCESRTIQCEGCEEMVDIDIFDFHLEICPANSHNPYAMYQAENPEFLPEMNNNDNNDNNNEQEEEQNQENWNGEGNLNQEQPEEEGEEDDFDPDMMTYEQLMTLDNFVVKKGLTTDELKNLPVKVFLKSFDGNCGCSICITDCESGEVVRQLPCSHKFHRDCIDTWLESNITCPVCKKYLR